MTPAELESLQRIYSVSHFRAQVADLLHPTPVVVLPLQRTDARYGGRSARHAAV